eukprot:TRINITY_DN225_c0_g1_i2.p5 TRINITY_DN225_c0_g1~~TRINITY_DN225_c0_g1_i2.p5  ORF type:complete len:441 (-),score=58.90 TRINITY_DN225_c0_g1_i2:5785-7107(-)
MEEECDDVIQEYEGIIQEFSESEETKGLAEVLRKLGMFVKASLEASNKEEERSILNCILRQILLWVIDFAKPSESFEQTASTECENSLIVEKLRKEKENLEYAYRAKIAELESAITLKEQDLDKFRKSIKGKEQRILALQVQLAELKAAFKSMHQCYAEQVENLKKEVLEKDKLVETLVSSDNDEKSICTFCRNILEDETVENAYLGELNNRLAEQKAEISKLQENLEQANKLILATPRPKGNYRHSMLKYVKELQGLKSSVSNLFYTMRTEMLNIFEVLSQAFRRWDANIISFKSANHRALFVPYSAGAYAMLTLEEMLPICTKHGEVVKSGTKSVVLLDLESLPINFQNILKNHHVFVIGLIKQIHENKGQRICELKKIEHVIKFDEGEIIDYEFMRKINEQLILFITTKKSEWKQKIVRLHRYHLWPKKLQFQCTNT